MKELSKVLKTKRILSMVYHSQPDGAKKISKVKRIPYWTTMKLGGGHKINENSKRSYEKIIWQEETKSTRIEGRRQHVIISQKYLFELTLKKAGPEEIQTF